MDATETREYFDDTRTVVIHTKDSPSVSRPYTAEENAAADAKQQVKTNEETLNSEAGAQIASLRTSIATLQAIEKKANPAVGPSDTKDLARELVSVSRQVQRLTRLMLRTFDSLD